MEILQILGTSVISYLHWLRNYLATKNHYWVLEAVNGGTEMLIGETKLKPPSGGSGAWVMEIEIWVREYGDNVLRVYVCSEGNNTKVTFSYPEPLEDFVANLMLDGGNEFHQKPNSPGDMLPIHTIDMGNPLRLKIEEDFDIVDAAVMKHLSRLCKGYAAFKRERKTSGYSVYYIHGGWMGTVTVRMLDLFLTELESEEPTRDYHLDLSPEQVNLELKTWDAKFSDDEKRQKWDEYIQQAKNADAQKRAEYREIIKGLLNGLEIDGLLDTVEKDSVEESKIAGRPGLEHGVLIYRLAKAQEAEEIRLKDTTMPWKEISDHRPAHGTDVDDAPSLPTLDHMLGRAFPDVKHARQVRVDDLGAICEGVLNVAVNLRVRVRTKDQVDIRVPDRDIRAHFLRHAADHAEHAPRRRDAPFFHGRDMADGSFFRVRAHRTGID